MGDTCNKEKKQALHISKMHISKRAGVAYQQDASQKGDFARPGSGGIIYGLSATKNLTSFFADFNTLFLSIERTKRSKESPMIWELFLFDSH